MSFTCLFGLQMKAERLFQVPFLVSEQLPGFLSVTLVMLTWYRLDFLAYESLDDTLIFIKAFRSMPVPPNLLFSCQLLLPRAQLQVA